MRQRARAEISPRNAGRWVVGGRRVVMSGGLSALKLAAFLPYRLSVLSNRVSSLIARGYSAKFAIGIPEWRVVAVIGESPGLTATEVAAQTAMDKVAVTRAVKTLVDKGHLKRHASQTDGRVNHLRLTRKGRAVYARIAPLAETYEQDVFCVLSSVERSQLDEIIDKLSQRLAVLEALEKSD